MLNECLDVRCFLQPPGITGAEATAIDNDFDTGAVDLLFMIVFTLVVFLDFSLKDPCKLGYL